jgi:hypothetical protein
MEGAANFFTWVHLQKEGGGITVCWLSDKPYGCKNCTLVDLAENMNAVWHKIMNIYCMLV